MCAKTIDMYLSIVGYSCSIVSKDYVLTMDYDRLIVSLGKSWFQIDRYHCIDISKVWLTWVNSCSKYAWY